MVLKGAIGPLSVVLTNLTHNGIILVNFKTRNKNIEKKHREKIGLLKYKNAFKIHLKPM